MMDRLAELKYDITKLDAKIKNMQDRIEKMALHDKKEVGIEFLTSTVKYFKELREYLRAEEQGLLLRLPCKVGDSIYSVIEDGFTIVELKFSLDFYARRKNDFGKTVFLTQEEAEQKLKEMEDKLRFSN